MVILSPNDTLSLIRALPSRRQVPVRNEFGALLMFGTPYECELLLEQETGSVEGVGSKAGFRYLRLKGTGRAALARLNRRLYATGRTVATASQLTMKVNVAGGRGVLYQHITKRTNTYAPALRGDYLKSITARFS